MAKVTKKEQYLSIREMVKDNEEYVAFIDAQIAQLDARAGKVAAKRAEKNGAKAEVYTEAIIKALEDAGRSITLAELVAGVGIEDATAGRVAHYVGKLVAAGRVIKDKDKVDNRKIMTYALGE